MLEVAIQDTYSKSNCTLGWLLISHPHTTSERRLIFFLIGYSIVVMYKLIQSSESSKAFLCSVPNRCDAGDLGMMNDRAIDAYNRA